MVYYTDETPGVNKRAVAGYYLFLVLIGFAILLGPTGSGIPISLVGNEAHSDGVIAAPFGTDPDACSSCHSNEYGNWSASGHATHVTTNGTHVSIGSHFTGSVAFFNASCSKCHTSGWDNSTGTPEYDALGVNCFACHDGTPTVDYSGDACSTCHTGSGEHPYQYQQWSDSAHANSLTDLRTSSHAGSSCMHCMSTEGFIDQAGDYDPADMTLSPVSCPACHSVHSEWSDDGPHMIRAVNASELCGLCHIGSHHPTYTVWIGGPHNLAGVECTDCHGYDLTPGLNAFLNHTFAVDPSIACGQTDDCHNGTVEWALNQLEEIQTAFETLLEEFETEAAAFTTVVTTYNATADADHAFVDTVLTMVDDAETLAHYYNYDGSSGFHDPPESMGGLNEAFRDLLDAKAYFYENMPEPTTPPPSTTTTTDGGAPVDQTLIIVGGAAGGIVVGLLLGVLVGRRR
ncbi:MAG: ammonia-forming cytochrome c nitrite reductase subunit c552 [Candidatus Thorarchaeota archaeon]